MLLVMVGLGIAACAEAAPEEEEEAAGAVAIAAFEDPQKLLGEVSMRLADNVETRDVGQTFGVPDAQVPYPDTNWPMVNDGIAAQWNGETPSPLTKYMGLADPANLFAAYEWNSVHAGTRYARDPKPWFGICHGWTAASILEAPLKHGVWAKLEGEEVVACKEGATDCLHFEIGDINALMATIYTTAKSSSIGARCDTRPEEIRYDAHGRVTNKGCRGLNPGALLVVLRHRLKRDQKPLAINDQHGGTTDEINNQPAYRYTVNRFERLTEAEAANWVARGTSRGSSRAKYRWNPEAKGFAFVDLSVHWVDFVGPHRTAVSGLDYTKRTRMTAVIELDRDAHDPDSKIIGGELVKDDDVRTNRLLNHPFVWIPTELGEDKLPGMGRNPYVKSAVVKQLMKLARE